MSLKRWSERYFELVTGQSNRRFWLWWTLLMFNGVWFDLIPSLNGEHTGLWRGVLLALFEMLLCLFLLDVAIKLRVRSRARRA
jgi:hypothetical protein